MTENNDDSSKGLTKGELIEFLKDCPDDSEIIMHLHELLPSFNSYEGFVFRATREPFMEGERNIREKIDLIGYVCAVIKGNCT